MGQGLTPAERNFFDILSSDSHDKTAVELDPATRQLLNANESPDDLDLLEGAAAPKTPAPQAKPAQGASQETATVQEPPAHDAGGETAAPETAAPYAAPPEPPQEVGPLSTEDADPLPFVPTDDELELPTPELPTRSTHGKLFNARRAHPMQLLEVLNSKYKQDWLDWESETLWWAIRKDFGPVGEITRNKIQALRTAITSFAPWDDWDAFENSSLAWNDLTPIFGAYQPMTPSQTALGVTLLRALEPNTEFANEVKAYIAAVLDEYGFVYAPEEWFDGAQELLDRDKGWVAPFRDQVAAAWAKARTMDPHEIEWREDNPLDVHIGKLMVIRIYLAERAALRNEPLGLAWKGSSSPVATSPPVP